MTTRSVFLVGSMPFDNEEACMRRALAALGSGLFSLPDGEIGEKTAEFPTGIRSSWVNLAIEKMTADTENWRVVREPVRGEDGFPVDYGSFQHLEALHPLDEMANRIELGYDNYFQQSYPVFKQLREEYNLPDLKFQLGIPTGSALGFAFSSPEEGMRYREMFNTVLAREVNAALQTAGDDVIVQIEVPPELYAAYHYPDLINVLSLAPIYDLLGKIEAGAQVGMHLCLGDFHNQSINHPDTLDSMIEFSNRLVDDWPQQHQLMYIHYPLAEGSIPPTLEMSYYAPLKDIRLPDGVRFIAGFVHEKRTLDENKAILDTIEKVRGQQVAVACSCGLGRRSPQVTDQLFDFMTQLAAV